MTDLLTDERTKSDERTVTSEPGDHERLSHYADKDAIMRAMVEGTPCTALCGKTWVPTRDGEKFPTCPECQEVWDTLE